MIFSGRTRTKVRAMCSPISHLVTVVPHVRPGRGSGLESPNAGTGFKEGKSGLFSQVVDLVLVAF